MPNFLKQYILILFTGLLLFNTSGSLIFFKLREASIERAFKAALKNNEIKRDIYTVDFTDDELKNAEWENTYEVNVKGRWYDVISTQFKYGHTIYTCLADHDETALYDWYKQHKKSKAEDGTDDEDFLRILINTYTFISQDIAYLINYLQTIITQYTGIYAQAKSAPHFLPPKG